MYWSFIKQKVVHSMIKLICKSFPVYWFKLDNNDFYTFSNKLPCIYKSTSICQIKDALCCNKIIPTPDCIKTVEN